MIRIEKGAGRPSDSLHNILGGKPPKKLEKITRSLGANLGGLFSFFQICEQGQQKHA